VDPQCLEPLGCSEGGPAHRGPRGVAPGGATPYQGPILCAEKKPATLSGAGSNPSAAVQRDQLP